MKSKKLAMALVAITMSATTALAFTACGKGGHTEHDYAWTTTRDATCTEEGEKKGTCSCGDETTEKIPVLGHSYGEWQITKPDNNGTGTAKKVCGNDSAHAHDITVTLPALSEKEKYTITEGDTEDTYEYNDATNGKITFKVEKAFQPVVKGFTADDFEECDGGYGVVYTYTATRSGYFNLSMEIDEAIAEDASVSVYASRQDFDNFEDPILSNELGTADDPYHPIGLSGGIKLVKDTVYNIFVFADTKGSYELTLSAAKPTEYTSAVAGANTVTLTDDVPELFEFSGEAGKKYVLSFADGTQHNPSIVRIIRESDYLYQISNEYAFYTSDNYLALTASESGKIYFYVIADADGDYTFKIEEAVPVTGFEVNDEDGNAITSYTLTFNESDYTLLNSVKCLPAKSDRAYQIRIGDETVVSYNGYYLQGLKEGITTLTLIANAGTAAEVTKVINLKVEMELHTIAVGENVFDYESELGSLEGAGAYYRFTGTANTDYVVTFTKGEVNYGWEIEEVGSNPRNYFNKEDTRVRYITVTTDRDGNATLLVTGNGTGTLTVVLASEFEDPGSGEENGPEQDIDGRYILKAGENSGYDVAVSGTAYFVFTGDANTDYTVKLGDTPMLLGQCDDEGAWLVAEGAEKSYIENTKEDWGGVVSFSSYLNSYTVTTDASGKAYIKVTAGDFVLARMENLTVTVTQGRVDEYGYVIIGAGENAGLSVAELTATYFTVKGQANSEYSVTLSAIANYFGQCDSSRDYIRDYIDALKISNVDPATYELTGTEKTCTVNTDADGVAYLRINSTDGIGDLTITVTYVGEATPVGPGPEDPGDETDIPTVTADPDTGSCEITVSNGDYMDPVTYNFVVAISFTPATTSTYTITVTNAGGETVDVYDSVESMNDGIGIYTGQELVAGTEYTFYISVYFDGNYTFTATV